MATRRKFISDEPLYQPGESYNPNPSINPRVFSTFGEIPQKGRKAQRGGLSNRPVVKKQDESFDTESEFDKSKNDRNMLAEGIKNALGGGVNALKRALGLFVPHSVGRQIGKTTKKTFKEMYGFDEPMIESLPPEKSFKEQYGFDEPMIEPLPPEDIRLSPEIASIIADLKKQKNAQRLAELRKRRDKGLIADKGR